MKWKNQTDDQQSNYPFSINLEDNMDRQIRVVDSNIFFYGDIDSDSCLELNRILIELDNKLQSLKYTLGDSYNPVIHLRINTSGGSIYDAFSTTDIIRSLKSEVYTYCDGLVASAGTLISLVGKKRFIGRYGHMLIHQLSSEIYGTFNEMQASMDTSTELMKILKEFYKKYTKVPMKKMDELMTKDIYLKSYECLLYGMVDEVI